MVMSRILMTDWSTSKKLFIFVQAQLLMYYFDNGICSNKKKLEVREQNCLQIIIQRI